MRKSNSVSWIEMASGAWKAGLAAATADEGAEALFVSAAEVFRQTDTRFWLATTLAEHAESLSSEGRREEAAPLIDEAREIFETLGGVVWLDRLSMIPATTL